MNAMTNLISIADEVIASATSDNGRAFAEKVVAAILAKGNEWIQDNAVALNIGLSADAVRETAPVADNRMFYIKKWQLVLAG